MQYVMGIDGGATKTLLKMSTLEGNLIASYEAGPANINVVGSRKLKKTLSELIINSVKSAGMDLNKCKCLCIGTAGAGREKERKMLVRMIKDIGFTQRLIVTDDVITAFHGGVGENEGIIIISGTGSICFGKNSKGESFRTGGWGYIIGDEGSGYYIGRRILNTIMRSYDNREGYTVLTPLVLSRLNLNNPEDLVKYVYRSRTEVREISELAKLADDACDLGDTTAENILKDTARELFCCVKTVIERLKFSDKRITIAVNGSVLVKSKYVRNEFDRLICEAYPLINVSPMRNDSAWGAVMMALEETRRTGSDDAK